ncbi:MAG: pyridoxamine 5'-phosphate oxidase family protein [Gloeobacteraceae cyanobacterium ES-bin-144]|nr:pyridoxamine 5'-phosphate oxidase family protein [Verrucomicrobiales bacterium]
MSEIKNLIADKAVTKLQQLVKGAPTCMFATCLGEIPFHVCPMQVQETDYEGRLWFFSGADSTHNSQIETDPRVQLIFANPSDIEFLTVYGTATISQDRELIARLWNKMVEAWFPGGQDDPNLTLICVQPTAAHYWDTENGKLITMAKILTAAATGADMNIGVEGNLEV